MFLHYHVFNIEEKPCNYCLCFEKIFMYYKIKFQIKKGIISLPLVKWMHAIFINSDQRDASLRTKHLIWDFLKQYTKIGNTAVQWQKT